LYHLCSTYIFIVVPGARRNNALSIFIGVTEAVEIQKAVDATKVKYDEYSTDSIMNHTVKNSTIA
jgi:bifunctional DNase/RNase